jgi:competence ComEA-like helix-hairpin-helix protein
MKFILTAIAVASSFAMADMPGAPAIPSPDSLTKEAEAKASGDLNKLNAAKGAAKEAAKKALVNLNTASPEELAKLPGVGPTRAKAIVDGRPYSSVNDLSKIKGLKEATVAKLKAMVTVK